MATDFGSDFVFDMVNNDIDPSFSVISDLNVVAQDIYKRLTTPGGTVFCNIGYNKQADPNFGFSIPSMIGESFSPTQIQQIKFSVINEVKKDERIDQVQVQTNYNNSTQELTINMVVSTANGPFNLVFLLSSSTIKLIQNSLNPNFIG